MLMILDEIHLLQDERGAVIEALVARTLRLGTDLKKSFAIVLKFLNSCVNEGA